MTVELSTSLPLRGEAPRVRFSCMDEGHCLSVIFPMGLKQICLCERPPGFVEHLESLAFKPCRGGCAHRL